MYQVTIERMADSARFRRTIAAVSVETAIRAAYALLGTDAAAYYVISAVPLPSFSNGSK